MSLVQWLVKSVVSETLWAAMEEESRRWIIRCPKCGGEVSFWDIGGIRYRAYSYGKRMLRRCRKCSRISWQEVYKKDQPAEAINAA